MNSSKIIYMGTLFQRTWIKFISVHSSESESSLMIILLFLGFADFGLSSFSSWMLNLKEQSLILPIQAPVKTSSGSNDSLGLPAFGRFTNTCYSLGQARRLTVDVVLYLKSRTFCADAQLTLFCTNRGSTGWCDRLAEQRNWRGRQHP